MAKLRVTRDQARFLKSPQMPLFQPALQFNPFPPIYRNLEGFRLTLAEARAAGFAGFDLEFEGRRPTIIGIASPRSCAALPWDARLCLEVIDSGAQLVAHAGAGADAPVVEAATGRRVPLKRWEDSMLLHYLLGLDFAAQPGKDEDDDDKQALGLMNLWAMASYWLDIPQWKRCRGYACDGPCPRHDPHGYCAVDAWAGLVGFLTMMEEAVRMKLPLRVYEEHKKLAVICELMQERGVTVDMAYIDSLEQQFQQHKQGIFPHEIRDGKRMFGTWDEETQEFAPAPFNPNSPAQIIAYFAGQFAQHPKLKGIRFEAAQKKDIVTTLKRLCDKLGVDYTEQRDLITLQLQDDTPKIVQEFYGVYQWKFAGKGLTGWFAEKYLSKQDRIYEHGKLIRAMIHPRFIPVSTSTTRLASSNPNFQNIPIRGWASAVRQAIIPRDAGDDILKADKKQLELRMCLYASGAPMPVGDAFTWLAEKAEVFKRYPKPRDVAKSVSHAFDYLEGLSLRWPQDLKTDRSRKEIETGALVVHRDWTYRGQIVCFTGSNLAKRLYGDASFDNRRKALEVQETYSKEFPQLRAWQRKMTQEIEDQGYIRASDGAFIYLDGGTPEEHLKLGAAFIGQGQSARHMHDIMIRYWEEQGEVWTLQVHDEAVVEKSKGWTDQQFRDWTQVMEEETWRFPGFKCPVDVKRGPNWGQTKSI